MLLDSPREMFSYSGSYNQQLKLWGFKSRSKHRPLDGVYQNLVLSYSCVPPLGKSLSLLFSTVQLLLHVLQKPKMKKENGKLKSMIETVPVTTYFSQYAICTRATPRLNLCMNKGLVGFGYGLQFLFWTTDLIRTWKRSLIVWARNLTLPFISCVTMATHLLSLMD